VPDPRSTVECWNHPSCSNTLAAEQGGNGADRDGHDPGREDVREQGVVQGDAADPLAERVRVRTWK
jgi:hypothetical protein